MRVFLLLISVLWGTLILAQSKQKINTQLNAELVVKRQAYDSMTTLYDSLNNLWRFDYNKAHVKRMDQFRAFEKDIHYCVSEIQKSNSILKKLGQPETLVKEPRFTDMVAIVVKYKSSVLYSPSHEYVSEMNTDGATLKENNLHLKEYIHNLDEAYPINKNALDSIRYHMLQMDKLFLEVKPVLEDYQVQNEYFNKEHIKLLKRLKDLKEDYFINGPAGFPDVYGEVFPQTNEAQPAIESFKDLPPLPAMSKEEITPTCDIIYEIVEELAEYPGGRDAMMHYFTTNIEVPKGKESVSGKVYLRFVISEAGMTNNAEIMKGMENCPECDAEAIRLVENMPMWIPAKHNGAAVCMKYVVSVPFNGK